MNTETQFLSYGETRVGKSENADLQTLKTGLAAYIDKLHGLATERNQKPEIIKMAEQAISKFVEGDAIATLLIEEPSIISPQEAPKTELYEHLVGKQVKVLKPSFTFAKGDIVTIKSVKGETITFDDPLHTEQSVDGFYTSIQIGEYKKLN